MDKERLFEAVSSVVNGEHIRASIGTYSEKTVHSVLKKYFEPDISFHEQKTGGFVADILNENGIIEIQTAGFDKLRKKLSCFLKINQVMVVYPIPYNKWLIPIDPETTELGKRRRSPKRGSPYELFPELYKIKQFLHEKNLSFCIVMLDVEEYRCPPEKEGLRRGRRKGYTRYDRIPVDIHDEIYLRSQEDWAVFIPDALDDEYTSKEFAEKAGIRVRLAQYVLNILIETGTVERTGKRGNSFLYRTLL